MTGFAQSRINVDNFSLYFSIKSLNNKFLDINIRGTGITPITEKMIKESLKKKVFRGKIDITFDMFERDYKNWNIQFNEGLLNEILDKILYFKKKYKNDLVISLDSLLKIPMIFHLDYNFNSYNDTQLKRIEKYIAAVIKDFIKSRETEGKEIGRDISESLKKIDEHVKEIEKESKKVEKMMFDNYKKKIERFLKDMEIDERRIVQEAGILSDKSCIIEEINRLKAHSKRMKQLLKDKSVDMKGKEADFLSQEMLRETYTISAKINSMDIHDDILKVRREIEKIRQQVQNVE